MKLLLVLFLANLIHGEAAAETARLLSTDPLVLELIDQTPTRLVWAKASHDVSKFKPGEFVEIAKAQYAALCGNEPAPPVKFTSIPTPKDIRKLLWFRHAPVDTKGQGTFDIDSDGRIHIL
ncbi:MAG: hypothetical protein ABL958_06980, partial [Bdellovibrionia bacterium]